MSMIQRVRGAVLCLGLACVVGGCTEDPVPAPAQSTGGVPAVGTGGAPVVGATGGAPVVGATGGAPVVGATGGAPVVGATGGAPVVGATGGAPAGTGGVPAGTGGVVAGGMTAEQCTASVMAGGTTVTACETCLCQPNNCQNELKAVGDDAKANALVKCTTTMNCQGSCCLCGNTAMACDLVTYGTGPCAAAFETAAGLTPGAGVLVNGAMVAPACKVTAGTSCSKAAALGQCAMTKCATQCPPKGPTCAIPPPA